MNITVKHHIHLDFIVDDKVQHENNDSDKFYRHRAPDPNITVCSVLLLKCNTQQSKLTMEAVDFLAVKGSLFYEKAYNTATTEHALSWHRPSSVHWQAYSGKVT